MQKVTSQSGGVGAVLAALFRERPPWAVPAALLVVVMGINFASLLRTPAPFVDEAWFTSRAWELIHSGRAYSTLDAGVLDKLDSYWIGVPLLEPLIQSLPLRVLGLSLFAARLPSLLFGLLLLLAVYTIARRLDGPRAGLLAVFLVSLSSPFLYSSHLARPDIIIAALGFGAVALYLMDRGPGLSVGSVLSGLAIGLAFEIHMNAVIYGLVLVALYLVDYRWALLRVGRFWGFAAGAALGLGFYVVLHVLPNPQTYFTLASPYVGDWRTPPLLTSNPGLWLLSLRDTLALLLLFHKLEVAIVVAAVLFLARRRSPSDLRLLVLFGALFLAFVALLRYKSILYAILICPAADLMVAVFLAAASRQRWGHKVASFLAVVLLWSIVAFSVGLNLFTVLNDPMVDFRATLQRVQATVPSGRSVMGAQTYWFGLPDERYYSLEQLSLYQRFNPGSTLEDALRSFHPDFLVLDRHVEQFIAYDRADLPDYFKFLYLSRAELEGFLSRQARLVATVDTSAYGNVRIYQISWN